MGYVTRAHLTGRGLTLAGRSVSRDRILIEIRPCFNVFEKIYFEPFSFFFFMNSSYSRQYRRCQSHANAPPFLYMYLTVSECNYTMKQKKSDAFLLIRLPVCPLVRLDSNLSSLSKTTDGVSA